MPLIRDTQDKKVFPLIGNTIYIYELYIYISERYREHYIGKTPYRENTIPIWLR